MTESARSRIENGSEESLSAVVGECEPEKIGAAGMEVLFIAGRIGGSKLQEYIPRRRFDEEFLLCGLLAGDLDDAALCSAAAFPEDGDSVSGIEGTRGIVIGKRREQGFDLGQRGGKGIPGIAIAVIDDGSGAEDLLDARGVFAGDTDDHVDELGEAEGLLHDGAHADVAGVFVGVAHGDLVG